MTTDSSSEDFEIKKKTEEKQAFLRSVKGFNVIKRNFDKKIYSNYVDNHEDKIMAELLASRGVTLEEKNDFLEPKLKNLLPKTTNVMKDTLKAVERILQAIDNNEKICIFGDYDVDGSTSTAMLLLFFEQLGIQAEYYIPDRLSEGYGPNCDAMEKIAKNGTKLLITVDCGTSAFEPLDKANSLGMDVIIIDHHQSSETLPTCMACVNPNRFDETEIKDEMKCLCACGVSFFILMSLNTELKKKDKSIDLLQFVPLVAFATVCDVMRMTLLNRAFIKTGINVLQKKHLFNLVKLIEANRNGSSKITQTSDSKDTSMIQITHNSFGFLLGPMVNAGGRTGNSSLGVQLMIEKDEQKAGILAKKLFDLNEERKQIESDALCGIIEKKSEIQKQIKENGYIMLYSKDWHDGVIGLMASRIKDRYSYPVFVGTESQDGVIKFSTRSVESINIGEVIIEALEKGLLTSGGGHKLAGGLACKSERIEDLKQFLREKIKQNADNYFSNRITLYDVALSLGGITTKLLGDIAKFEPFGNGNDKPIFLVQNVFVKKVNLIKDKHVSLFINDNENFERAICFNCVGTKLGEEILLSEGKNVTLLVSAELGNWNGQMRKNIKIEDMLL